ncbi:MAG: polymer-forming cytoskeletal protein [Magnetospirillum sp. WYHS-4]
MGQAKHPKQAKTAKRLREIVIDGCLDGDFAGRAITVLAGASVTGSLGARSIVVHGTVHGNISAPSVVLGETAVVEGELHYGKLTVAQGARLEARCIPA